MSRFVRNGGIALFVMLFGACSDSTAPLLSLAQARALWASHNLSTYSYTGTQVCSCGAPSGLVRVDVVNDVVTKVTDLATGAEVGLVGFINIDQLLNLADTFQPLPVEFDRQFGFPKRVERCCVADDSGAVYTVTGVS